MIRKCRYGKNEFEIEFEWRLSKETLKEVKGINSFFKKVASLPGTSVLEKEGYITGLVIPYSSFYELLSPFKRVKEKDVQIADEFKDFFTLLREEVPGERIDNKSCSHRDDTFKKRH